MAATVVLVNHQGGYLSSHRPHPSVTREAREWEKWTIEPLEVVEEGKKYKVAIRSNRDGKYLSAQRAGLVEHKDYIRDWEKFIAEIVDRGSFQGVRFRTHKDTYMNVWAGPGGWVRHDVRAANLQDKQDEVLFYITTPEATIGRSLVLNSHDGIISLSTAVINFGIRVLIGGLAGNVHGMIDGGGAEAQPVDGGDPGLLEENANADDGGTVVFDEQAALRVGAIAAVYQAAAARWNAVGAPYMGSLQLLQGDHLRKVLRG